MAGLFSRLYVGHGALDIVGRRRTWYIGFSVLVLVCIGSMLFRGFNFGIDFTGGTQLQFPATTAAAPADVEAVRDVYKETIGSEPAVVQSVGTGPGASVIVRGETLDPVQLRELKQALFDTFQPVGAGGTPALESISDSGVSGSWGGQITQQALIALGVFLVLVTIFLGFYFERMMAIAALVALLHDVVITAGIYSIVGFEVTPSTVVGLLTILGFSLYDTVVVFDKVKENTRGLLQLTRRTYAEAANLAVNQTLIRSINTSLFAVLPVLALLVIGVGLLGVGTLADLALVQMVGMIAGTVSSVLLATPLLVEFKLRDPRIRQQAARVAARRRQRAAAMGAGGDADGVTDSPDPDLADDAVLANELRKERALAAAAGVPARQPKPAQNRGRRPAGKAARPTGKRIR